MPSPFHGINLASTALRAFQRAMEVTGHNMANVNTRGYSRQTVEYQTLEPSQLWTYGGRVSIGGGVALDNISRVRAGFLDGRMQSAMGDLGRSNTLANGLDRILGVYNEPGDLGIAQAMDKFFNGWSNLASNPNDATSRFELRQSASTLAQRIRTSFNQLEEVENGVRIEIKSIIDQVNDASAKIAKLNEDIRAATSMGDVPNDLMDARDLAIQDMSKLVNMSRVDHPDGTVSLYLSNVPLVSQTEAHRLDGTYDETTAMMVQANGPDAPVRSGELLGKFQTLQRISTARADLDTLANTLRTQVNALHGTGINRAGNTGVNFFNDSIPQSGARDFDLSADVLTSTDAIAAGITGAPGDGGLALSLSKLRNQNIAGLGDRTLGGFYRDALSTMSSEATSVRSSAETFREVVAQIEDQMQSVSGVSLDDEMAELMKLQRAYQASAQVLKVLDQTTEELIGLIR